MNAKRQAGLENRKKLKAALKPTQRNRNLLVHCKHCGFKFNTSRLQITTVLELHGEIMCCCCAKAMSYPKF